MSIKMYNAEVSPTHSRSFVQFIKKLSHVTAQQDEDELIAEELQKARSKLSESATQQSAIHMRDCVLRVVYAEMLGHRAEFGHIHCINLCSSPQLLSKYTGYLASCLAIPPQSKLAYLIVSTIQRDLRSSNYLEVAMALTAVTRLLRVELMQVVQADVVALLHHAKPILRRKAVEAMTSLCMKTGGADMDDSICAAAIPPTQQQNNSNNSNNKYKTTSGTVVAVMKSSEDSRANTHSTCAAHVLLRAALGDAEPTVVDAALRLLPHVWRRPRTHVRDVADLLDPLLSLLTQIYERRLPRGFQYHHSPAPWMQMRILRCMTHMLRCAHHTHPHHHLTSTTPPVWSVELLTRVSVGLAEAMRRADDGTRMGYAVMVELIRAGVAVLSLVQYEDANCQFGCSDAETDVDEEDVDRETNRPAPHTHTGKGGRGSSPDEDHNIASPSPTPCAAAPTRPPPLALSADARSCFATLAKMTHQAMHALLTAAHPNLRAVGLRLLSSLTALQPSVAAPHQRAIMGCLSDTDAAIAVRAVGLLLSICRRGNVRAIVQRLLRGLTGGGQRSRSRSRQRRQHGGADDEEEEEMLAGLVTDVALRRALTRRLCEVVRRYAPSDMWYVRTMTRILALPWLARFVPQKAVMHVMKRIAQGGRRRRSSSSSSSSSMNESSSNHNDNKKSGSDRCVEREDAFRVRCVELYFDYTHPDGGPRRHGRGSRRRTRINTTTNVATAVQPMCGLPAMLQRIAAWVMGEYGFLLRRLIRPTTVALLLDRLCDLFDGTRHTTTREWIVMAMMKLVATTDASACGAKGAVRDTENRMWPVTHAEAAMERGRSTRTHTHTRADDAMGDEADVSVSAKSTHITTDDFLAWMMNTSPVTASPVSQQVPHKQEQQQQHAVECIPAQVTQIILTYCHSRNVSLQQRCREFAALLSLKPSGTPTGAAVEHILLEGDMYRELSSSNSLLSRVLPQNGCCRGVDFDDDMSFLREDARRRTSESSPANTAASAAAWPAEEERVSLRSGRSCAPSLLLRTAAYDKPTTTTTTTATATSGAHSLGADAEKFLALGAELGGSQSRSAAAADASRPAVTAAAPVSGREKDGSYAVGHNNTPSLVSQHARLRPETEGGRRWTKESLLQQQSRLATGASDAGGVEKWAGHKLGRQEETRSAAVAAGGGEAASARARGDGAAAASTSTSTPAPAPLRPQREKWMNEIFAGTRRKKRGV